MKKKTIHILFLSAAFFAAATLCGCRALCALADSADELAEQQSRAETAAQIGEAAADAAPFLPFPFDLLAAAGGTAAMIYGGRRASAIAKKLAALAATKAVAEAATEKEPAPAPAQTEPEENDGPAKA